MLDSLVAHPVHFKMSVDLSLRISSLVSNLCATTLYGMILFSLYLP
jgi:hypothetical protein